MEEFDFNIDELLKYDSINGSDNEPLKFENNTKLIDEIPLEEITKTFDSVPLEKVAPISSPTDTLIPVPKRRFPRPPQRVPGKEYSDNADKNTNGFPDPGQTLLWDGTGATQDGFDFSTFGQVDAMANPGDAYFYSLISDKAAMVFSTTYDDKIFFERPNVATGGIWANNNNIDAPGPGIDRGVDDVDALELWGPDNISDAFYYSVYGDVTYDPLSGGIVSGAVLDRNNNVIFTREEIAKAVANVTDLEADLLLGNLNLDAMMVSGNRIVFSVDPIERTDLNGTGFLDGGEIFVYDKNTGSSSYLKHGGHLWDTDFDVIGTFKTSTENINAIEAVPMDSLIFFEPDPVPGPLPLPEPSPLPGPLPVLEPIP
ncbi:MAG: hypothetical protein ACFB2X_09050 [Rivularia sp. (in: cyanobacteria)]